jgi:hypothetical protein
LKAIVIAAYLAGNSTVASALELAVTDVTVVDTRTGALAPHRTVLIREGRIASVGNEAPPADATVVRGTGKFLIPGLWDMVTVPRGDQRAPGGVACLLAIVPTMTRRRALPGTKIRKRIEQRINDSGHWGLGHDSILQWAHHGHISRPIYAT